MALRLLSRFHRRTARSVAWTAQRSLCSSPASGVYGGATIPFVNSIDIELPEDAPNRGAYRLLDEDGTKRPGTEGQHEGVSRELATEMYRVMVRVSVMDSILYDAQRQGRISFYMTSSGEEASVVGSAAALSPDDTIFGQYREQGALMWRGFTLQNFADQCFSNVGDPCKGRQMPIHYGSNALNFQTISSPLATQLPQATGAAYAMKIAKQDRCVCVYFGDGSASEGDFHPALNFAATLECPVLFFCRNNGYAISTPVEDQYRGDGIVSRAAGYGIASIRVDGNDALAVQLATAEARRLAVTESRPVLIEAMSYRQGHHSTSDDSSRYRREDVEAIEHWRTALHPIPRLRSYLEGQGWWTTEHEESLQQTERHNVLQALNTAESKPKPKVLEDLFHDVYKEIPDSLKEQQLELEEMITKYPEHYRLDH